MKLRTICLLLLLTLFLSSCGSNSVQTSELTTAHFETENAASQEMTEESATEPPTETTVDEKLNPDLVWLSFRDEKYGYASSVMTEGSGLFATVTQLYQEDLTGADILEKNGEVHPTVANKLAVRRVEWTDFEEYVRVLQKNGEIPEGAYESEEAFTELFEKELENIAGKVNAESSLLKLNGKDTVRTYHVSEITYSQPYSLTINGLTYACINSYGEETTENGSVYDLQVHAHLLIENELFQITLAWNDPEKSYSSQIGQLIGSLSSPAVEAEILSCRTPVTGAEVTDLRTLNLSDPLLLTGISPYEAGDEKTTLYENVSYPFYASGKNGTSEATLDFSWFEGSSYDYHEKLATTSMAMAISAFNARSTADGDANIRAFFSNFGFENYSANVCYRQASTENSIGVAFASRDTEDYTVIAIAIRGGNYTAEWSGNFLVGTETVDHEGFSIARDQVIAALKEYIELYGDSMKDRVKVWISGYSRGSAVANLTAAWLDENPSLGFGVNIAPEDLYAYCFEVPANTCNEEAGSELYQNIVNIINPADPVPRLALYQWGFVRYGKNMILPAMGVDATFNTYYQEVWTHFYEIYTLSSGESKFSSSQRSNQHQIFNNIMNDVAIGASTREEFVLYYQESIRQAIAQKMGGSGNASDEQIYLAALGSMVGLLGNVLFSHPDTALILIVSILANPDSSKLLFFPHYAEWTLAWMETLEGTGYASDHLYPNDNSYSGSYYNLLVK